MAEILKIKDVMKVYLVARHLTHAKFAKSLTENKYISTSRMDFTTGEPSEEALSQLIKSLVEFLEREHL